MSAPLLGTQIPRSQYNRQPSVIGEVLTSPKGNVILRVGHIDGDGLSLPADREYWTKTEHVVLTKSEARSLANTLLAYSKEGA